MMLTLASAGCTQMNGDIGPLFGRWNLVTLSADGVAQTLYESGDKYDDVLLYTWSFQGDLAWIQTLYPHNSFHTAKGMWWRTDTQLMLDYSHSDDREDGNYTPPIELHLVEGGVTAMNIESLTSSEMMLWHTSDDGVTYKYYLKKAY